MDEQPPPRNLLRYATVGIEFLLVFLLFLFAGWQVDRWIGWTRPAVTILGAITGFLVAMRRLCKQGWTILKSANPGGLGNGRRGRSKRQRRPGRREDTGDKSE